MTVIAWDGNILAADSLILSTSALSNMFGEKIKRVVTPTGPVLIGLAGPISYVAKFERYIESGCENDPGMRDEKYSAVMINGKGQLSVYENSLSNIIIDNPLFGIGSGADFAVGAMMAGANAIEAVNIAIRANAFCAGDILYYKLSDLNENIGVRKWQPK